MKSNILSFPVDNDLAPPRAVSTREIAAAIIDCSPAHARAVAEGRSRRPQEPSVPQLDKALADIEALERDSDAKGSISQNGGAQESGCTGLKTSAIGIVASAADIPTRPGNGRFNAALWSRCLKLRQLELEFAPVVVINREWARVVEKRVSAALYPKEAR